MATSSTTTTTTTTAVTAEDLGFLDYNSINHLIHNFQDWKYGRGYVDEDQSEYYENNRETIEDLIRIFHNDGDVQQQNNYLASVDDGENSFYP